MIESVDDIKQMMGYTCIGMIPAGQVEEIEKTQSGIITTVNVEKHGHVRRCTLIKVGLKSTLEPGDEVLISYLAGNLRETKIGPTEEGDLLMRINSAVHDVYCKVKPNGDYEMIDHYIKGKLHSYVLFEPGYTEPYSKNDFGILLSNEALAAGDDKNWMAKVRRVSKSVTEKLGIKEGDRCLLRSNSFEEVEIGDDKLWFVLHDSILGKEI